MNKRKIAKYYDITAPFYKHFWYKDSDSYALHYGFWEKGTKNFKEALVNTNKSLASKARIKPGDVVLDAGCGIGGSSIWIAKNFGARATGISISPKQVRKAKELAKINGVGQKTEFFVKDFTNTGFRRKLFDVVWAVESACHAENKKDFLAEAYRVLKPGGRVIIADGFLKRSARNDRERRIILLFAEGLALPNLAGIEEFRNYMKETGFKNIMFWDKTNQILPSSERLYRMCKIGYPVSKIAHRLGLLSDVIVKNNLAGIVQLEALKNGLGGYGIFYGEKPARRVQVY